MPSSRISRIIRIFLTRGGVVRVENVDKKQPKIATRARGDENSSKIDCEDRHFQKNEAITKKAQAADHREL